MKIHTLHKEQFVTHPLRDVFAFFEKPENLATITPPSMGFRILSPPPIEMKQGAVFEYSVKVMGVRLRWKSLISAYTPPFSFVDEQLVGPYKFWHHTHAFSEVDGGTRISDSVRYAMPFGVIGNLIQKLVVKRQLDGIFCHRARVINSLFEGKGVLA